MDILCSFNNSSICGANFPCDYILTLLQKLYTIVTRTFANHFFDTMIDTKSGIYIIYCNALQES